MVINLYVNDLRSFTLSNIWDHTHLKLNERPLATSKVKSLTYHLYLVDYDLWYWINEGITCLNTGILELQGWTDGRDPDSDWVMSALLVSCPQPRFRYVWPDFPWDICFRMFL